MNYEKLKITEIKKIAEEYDLPTNTTKEIMIKNIKLAEQDKFMYDTTCERFGKDEYLVGIDIKNQQKFILKELLLLFTFSFSFKNKSSSLL